MEILRLQHFPLLMANFVLLLTRQTSFYAVQSEEQTADIVLQSQTVAGGIENRFLAPLQVVFPF